MKNLILLCLLLALALPIAAADFKSGEEVVASMHGKYSSKWYKTLTFVQKTITYKPDGTSEVATWYEAVTLPGMLRIDFDPLEKGNGILFADGKLYSLKDGKVAGSRAFVHPLLVLGFDVYKQPVETTIAQIKEMNIDLSVIHQEMWHGQKVYVIGAKQGDVNTPQFWISKVDLLFVRLIQLGGRDKKIVQETQFNKYVKVNGGGWVSAQVEFYDDGKHRTTEEYSDIQTGVKLDTHLYDPEKWMTADRTYFKKK